mgnify:CR=1 FL=1
MLELNENPVAKLSEQSTQNPGKGPQAGRRLPATERKALEILDAKDNLTKPEIRKIYKGLIKVLHPDMNGGDRSQEEQLQQVVWAWDQLKTSRNFRTDPLSLPDLSKARQCTIARCMKKCSEGCRNNRGSDACLTGSKSAVSKC